MNDTKPLGLRGWFAANPVAANLLMLGIAAGGVIGALTIRQEVYPTFERDTVTVEMQYPGASPEEVERAVILPIESELRGLDLVRQLDSTARDGSAAITVEVVPGFDRNRALQEVTAAVLRVRTFPDEVESPVISLGARGRRSVMRLAVYGEMDDRGLVAFARQLEEGLLADPAISIVELRGVRRPEVHVDIQPATLRALGLTLADVARTIGASAVDVPAGTLRTSDGDIQLRTRARRERAAEFADIEILSTKSGARVRLGDIATLSDGFEESQREAYFNGRRAVLMDVYSAEGQAPLDVARAVRAFVDNQTKRLPDSVGVSLMRDRSEVYNERLSLLVRNGTMGLALVLIALGLFLNLRVAFWTAVGIPVSVLGSIILLPAMDATINMISLFAFIVTLGIVVDDAVVVGEDIFHKTTEGMSPMTAAIEGVREMTIPVIFAVTTNIIAFLPLLFVTGEAGRFFQAMPAVVIAVFTVSLVECLFILPAHLSHSGRLAAMFESVSRAQTRVRQLLEDGMTRVYEPILRLAISFRVVTIASFLVGLALLVGWVGSGRMAFAFRPTIETDFIQAEIGMPSGTPVSRTREVAFEVEKAAHAALEGVGGPDLMLGVFTEVAERSPNEAEVSVTLVPQSQRELTGQDYANRWREAIGTVDDLESLFFDYLVGPGGSAAIDIQLSHPEIGVLQAAAGAVEADLNTYPGVADIRKGFGRQMPTFDVRLNPAGRSTGLTPVALGQQLRHAFYGAEAIRQPRDRDELRVMVRYPEHVRRSLLGIEDLIIRTPEAIEIPLVESATVTPSRAPVRIVRVDGARVQRVTANIVPGVGNANRIIGAWERDRLAGLLAEYPGLRVSFEGEQREQREAIEELSWGLLAALFAIYFLLAGLLRSYLQGIIVLLTLPFSLGGAVFGHILLGYNLSIFSVFGMIALCGMVVNGAFVLAVTRNRLAERDEPGDLTVQAALRRYRPIVLTAITTFLGLAPMMFETSMQARFLVPMAISLGVGTLVSSAVILLLIPALLSYLPTRPAPPVPID